MLTNLTIKDFTLIDEMDIQFHSGLNVLTGETGAGKSIILDAINIIIGQETASNHYIRHGQETAYLEAVFVLNNHDEDLLLYLSENGIPVYEDLELIISRELSLSSRTITRINGRAASISQLKEIGNLLIDLHGQHEHQSLLKKELHRKLLDALLPNEALALKAEVTDIYTKLERAKRKYNELQTNARQRERNIELLQYEIDEIVSAKLEIGEDEFLESARIKIQNAEKLYSATNTSYNLLANGMDESGSILDNLKTLNNTLMTVADYDDTLRELQEKIDVITAELSEMSYSLGNFADNFEFSEGDIVEVEERINLLSKLKRKYGDTLEEILEYTDKKSVELTDLQNYSLKSDEYEADIIIFSEKLAKKVVELSLQRQKLATKLRQDIEQNLKTLGMKDAQFKIDLKAVPNENGIAIDSEKINVDKNGIDDIEFFISPNKGEPLMQLAKIASGGEVSRVMLSLKAVEASGTGVPTVIFDEIDSGVGGVTAEAVGVKLAEVAKSTQVIAVSHLTQIAMHADRHFLVEKDSDENHTTSHIHEINGDDVVYELARLQTGSQVTDMVLKHIREMLRNLNLQS